MIKSVLTLIGLRSSRHLFFIYVMTSLAAIIEMAGAIVAAYSILPELQESFVWITDKSKLLIITAIGLISGVALLLRIAAIHYEKYFANLYRVSMAEKVLYGLWSGPYKGLSSKNNSELVKSLTADADIIVGYAVDPIITVGSAFTSALIVTIFLIVYDPYTTIIVLSGILLYFVVFSYFSRNILQRLGMKAEEMLRLRQLYAQQIFSDVRSFKSKPIDQTSLQNLHKANRGLSLYASVSNDIAVLPRFLLETIITATMIGILITASSDEPTNTLSTLIVYGIAGLRLLPSSQKLFVSYAHLNYSKPFVTEFLNLMSQTQTRTQNYLECRTITLENCIIEKLDGTELTVPKFQIAQGEIVALTGASGSGKTTLVDTIIGLHEEYTGNYLMDGRVKPVSSFVATAYLTQKPNIPSGKIVDLFSGHEELKYNLREILDKVQLDTVTDQTYIGENARNLSGGELQRLAIVKSLHERCSLRVLDESFNAIAETARHDLFNVVKELTKTEMVIIITHDENIKKLCDREYVIIENELKVVR